MKQHYYKFFILKRAKEIAKDSQQQWVSPSSMRLKGK